MNQGDLELLAQAAYTRAGFSLADTVSPIRLAAALLGWDSFAESSAANDGSVSNGRVILPANLTAPGRSWFAARALAHWLLEALETNPTESSVALLAAALRTPAPQFRELADDFGPNFSELAEAFCISESSAALRFGEVTGDSMVLFAPGKPPRIRGIRRRGWRRTVRLESGRSVRLA